MTESKRKPMDKVGYYLKDIRKGKALENFSKKAGVSLTKLTAMRSSVYEPIKYIEALKICKASSQNNKLKISDFSYREIADREKYETPLGSKIAASILEKGDSIHSRLKEHKISHNELTRILLINKSWSPNIKKRLSSAFDSHNIKLNEKDYQMQKANRLKACWERAEESLKLKK